MGSVKAISGIALAILSLPFSNAAVERVFSIMSIVKNRLRNRMQCRMLDAILMVRFGLDWRNERSTNMTVTKDMYQLFKANVYESDALASVDGDFETVLSITCVE